MKKKIIFLLMTLMIFLTRSTFAANFSDSEIRLICAMSSMAAYEDDNGVLLRRMITDRGWLIESIKDKNDKANAKALIISKKFDDGSLTKILAICGTSEIKDAEVDLRLKPVTKQVEDQILIHQGFKDYSEVLIKDLNINLVTELNVNRNENLYLTGHSLGGAVAIVTAANLIDQNIAADRLKVITFAAPAVGNKVFVDKYKDKINLTRVTVSGDPIKKSLQVLGYTHFGEVVNYKPDMKMIEHFPHKMAVYLDCAIRDYYDNSSINKSNSALRIPNSELTYVAPMQVVKNSFTENDFKYIKAALRDQQKFKMPSAIFNEVEFKEVDEIKEVAMFDNSIEEILPKAAALNCKKILVQYIQAKKIKVDREGNYRVSIEEITFDLNGLPISMQTASVTTTELTLLEAAIFAEEKLLND
ncbi:MAG: lipase family protein [Selenomonadaceae bacterium]|nr:lipase family protein [Selenomonadaceae bacterium]